MRTEVLPMKGIVIFGLALLTLSVPLSSRAEFDLEQELLSIPSYHENAEYGWKVQRNPRDFDFTLAVKPGAAGEHEVAISLPGASRMEQVHVFVTDGDYETFEHFLPQETGENTYAFTHSFAKAGTYYLEIALKTAGTWVNLSKKVEIAGSAPTPSPRTTLEEQGYEIRVKPLPYSEIWTDHVVTLVFEILHHGQPVRDLEILHGAEMHVVAWRTGWFRKVGTFQYAASRQNLGGPRAAVSLVFDKPGRYRIFARFKHQNEIKTVELELDVDREPQRGQEEYPA